MAIFGGKKRGDTSAREPLPPTARRDVFSPLWSQLPTAAPPRALPPPLRPRTATIEPDPELERRLGARQRVLSLAVPADWLRVMELDAPTTAILARINGRLSIDDVLPGSHTERRVAMRALIELLEEGIVRAGPPLARR